jgi:hypothetical protein
MRESSPGRCGPVHGALPLVDASGSVRTVAISQALQPISRLCRYSSASQTLIHNLVVYCTRAATALQAPNILLLLLLLSCGLRIAISQGL